MSEFQPFEHEVMASQNEKEVDYNLSESGVHPLLLRELLTDSPEYIETLLATEIDYAHANGDPKLRENIAALYSGCTSSNVLVTVGAIEANYNSIHTLLQPGDEIAIMLPNYMQIWGRHEYTTLSTSIFSNILAALALSVNVRPRIIQRTRNYIRKGFPLLQQWIDHQKDTFRLVPPQAAAIAFVRYQLDVNSTELANKLIQEKSVLIVPGDHFGMDKFIRISYGLPQNYLTEGLKRIQQLVTEIRDKHGNM